MGMIFACKHIVEYKIFYETLEQLLRKQKQIY